MGYALFKIARMVHVLESGPYMRPYRTLCGFSVREMPEGSFVNPRRGRGIDCEGCQDALVRRRPDRPREMTEDEVRARFLEHVRGLVDYWLAEGRRPGAREKMEGLAFSILSMLDGCSAGIPGFVVAPSPHKDDREYRKALRENWWPEDGVCDIAGGLHEQFHKRAPEAPRKAGP